MPEVRPQIHRTRRPLPVAPAGAAPAPQAQAPMTRTLLRSCLGCGRSVRGRPRCVDCERDYQRAKRAKRPDLYADAAERRRRARTVADHRAIVGDWCPGWSGQPAHQSADLTADHVREVAAGGRPDGKLVVRCRSCNAARSTHLARRALAAMAVPPRGVPASTPRPPKFPTHGDDGPGPVAA
jgi:5-methylcytosine-specific restriction protein A